MLGTRAVLLAKQPEQLGGIDEKKWFQAAGPVRLAESLGAVRGDLQPGGEVWLRIPSEWDPVWWGWMARYHLPEQRIAGVLPPGAEAPAGAWIVEVQPDAKVVVRGGPR